MASYNAQFDRSSPVPMEPSESLDFSILPVVYVLPTHFSDDELQNFEEKLTDRGVSITYDPSEARLVFGKVGTKRRAEYDLRVRGLTTSPVELDSLIKEVNAHSGPSPKRRRTSSGIESTTDDSTTETEADSPSYGHRARKLPRGQIASDVSNELGPEFLTPFTLPGSDDVVSVFKHQWFDDCIAINELRPLKDYLVYIGRKTLEKRPSAASTPIGSSPAPASQHAAAWSDIQKDITNMTKSILERAKADAASSSRTNLNPFIHGPRPFRNQHTRDNTERHHFTQKPKLLEKMTSEYEGEEGDVPEPPDWVKKGIKYACQRSTRPHPPNEAFIEQLKHIRTARILMLDEIGVRAYSTSIAAIAAYPYPFTTPREILQLPGCEQKIANLWVEWKNTGEIKEAKNALEDPALKVLRLFYNIWGVGAQTAREFYFDKGWLELDDIVEFGWSTLTRVQQIGVKFYEEFLTPIPREEVEQIAETIREHAKRIRDDGVEVVIVGGHRRGKSESADVDVIVSHRDLSMTAHLAHDIVSSLEQEEWITHTLILSEHNTNRGQATLPYRAPGIGGGHGFDSLDKALVVWQNPVWPTKEQDLAENPKAKNPNIHRRVDIIISPWRTVGCAIVGWSGGTTFQRDLRRYAKNVKGWKFDSSGVRDRVSGHVMLLEGNNGAETWQEAERKVFKGMGLEYREPEERVTG